MGDIIFHLLVAEETIKNLPQSLGGSSFIAGAVGPDIFSYYRFWLPPSHSLRKQSYRISYLLHNHRTGEFAWHALKEAQSRKSRPAQSYFAGYITHLVADVNIHPYILARAGIYPHPHPLCWEHKKLEMSVDVALLNHIRNITPEHYPFADTLSRLNRLPPAVVNIYREIIWDLYGINLKPKLIHNAFTHTKTALRIISKWEFLLTRIFPIIRRDFPTDLFLYRSYPIPEDPLNLSRRTWKHPINGKEISHTVLDIFHNTVKASTEIIREVLSSDTPPSLLRDNPSLDTGLLNTPLPLSST